MQPASGSLSVPASSSLSVELDEAFEAIIEKNSKITDIGQIADAVLIKMQRPQSITDEKIMKLEKAMPRQPSLADSCVSAGSSPMYGSAAVSASSHASQEVRAMGPLLGLGITFPHSPDLLSPHTAEWNPNPTTAGSVLSHDPFQVLSILPDQVTISSSTAPEEQTRARSPSVMDVPIWYDSETNGSMFSNRVEYEPQVDAASIQGSAHSFNAIEAEPFHAKLRNRFGLRGLRNEDGRQPKEDTQAGDRHFEGIRKLSHRFPGVSKPIYICRG